MKQDFEVSIDTDQPDVESVSVQKNGVFDKINRHTRTLAMWTLGLIGGGGIGCAHTQIAANVAPYSSSRNVCVAFVSRNDGLDQSMKKALFEILNKYIKTKYTHITVIDLDIIGGPRYGATDEFNYDKELGELVDNYIQNLRQRSTVMEQCDDVIGIELFHYTFYRQFRELYKYLDFKSRIYIINLETDNVVMDRKIGTLQNDDYPLVYPFSAEDDEDVDGDLLEDFVDDIIDRIDDERLIPQYDPARLLPSSINTYKTIQDYYRSLEKREISKSDIIQLYQLADDYFLAFPSGKYTQSIKQILQKLEPHRYYYLELDGDQDSHQDFIELIESAKEEYLAFFKKLRNFRENHDLQNPRLINYLETLTYQVIEDRKMKTATIANTPIPIYGKKAKFTGISFEPGDPIYIGSWFLGSNGDPFDQSTYHNFAFATTLDGSKQGLIMDEDVKKISGLSQPPPVEMPEGWRISKPGESTFEEGAKMAGEIIVEALPYIGAGTEALAAYVREDLDRRGLTATVEISIAEYTFLSRYPVENVEVTIRQLGGSNSSQTSKTSKENLLETGGRVHFYLAPGWYEISSPLFKYSRTVELKKGLQVLEFQLR